MLQFTKNTQMWSKSARCLSDSRNLTLRLPLSLPQELPEGQARRNKGRISSTCPAAAQFKCSLVGLTMKQVPTKSLNFHFRAARFCLGRSLLQMQNNTSPLDVLAYQWLAVLWHLYFDVFTLPNHLHSLTVKLLLPVMFISFKRGIWTSNVGIIQVLFCISEIKANSCRSHSSWKAACV